MREQMGPEGPALIAFTSKADLKFLRWLKPGFRYCLIEFKSTLSVLCLKSWFNRLPLFVEPMLCRLYRTIMNLFGRCRQHGARRPRT